MPLFDPVMDAVFHEFADLQLRHHFFLVEGKEDAPETVGLEDRMEELWTKLDATQRQSLNGMRSDLNWVRRNGDPAPKGRKSPDEVNETEQQNLVAAIGSRQWHRIMHYLRLCA